MGGVNSRFASSASEILRIHEVAVQEDKAGYEIWFERFQRKEKICRHSTFKLFEVMSLALTYFVLFHSARLLIDDFIEG